MVSHRLQKKADKHRVPEKEDVHHMNMFIHDCSICAQEEISIKSRSLVTPEESAQHERLSGPKVRLSRKGFSFITTTGKGFKKK